MDLCSILSSPITLKELNLVRDEILQHPNRFSEVFELIFEEKPNTAWRAAWAVEKTSEKNPAFFTEKEILRLMNYSLTVKNGGLQRSILAILINLPLPEDLPVSFINACFERMISKAQPVAVQALSMRMLQRVAEKEPDFIPEILFTLENVDLNSVSAGYVAIRRKVMTQLQKRLKS